MNPQKRPLTSKPETSRPEKGVSSSANASSGPSGAAMDLSSLELALLAEFNLEMAAAHDEVADDPMAELATRESARQSASRSRQRAWRFQVEAQRLGAYPMSMPEQVTPEQPLPHTGPERRKTSCVNLER